MANLRFNITVFKRFIRSSTFGGILLLVCVSISLILANSGAGDAFNHLLHTKIGFTNSFVQLQFPVETWINDGLMAIFFLLVGLEIKRELVEGELASPRRALLPVVAAFGGAILPALIYLFINRNNAAGIAGWGIPMATDIAFAIGVLSLIGNKVPSSLKIFLAALAIVDDLIAILVIAVFYSEDIHFTNLLLALGCFGLMLLLNFLKCKLLSVYLLIGLVTWYLMHHSGIHATIAGVLTAMAIPTNKGNQLSPLEKLEHFLAGPVHYFIMPVFALANTNIRIEKSMISSLDSRLSLGIIIGLILGKTIGIALSTYCVVKPGWAKLPRDATWSHMIGIGLLGGIGFTMSIFIAILSFSDVTMQSSAKFAILIGSVLSGSLGCVYLLFLSRRSVKSNG